MNHSIYLLIFFLLINSINSLKVDWIPTTFDFTPIANDGKLSILPPPPLIQPPAPFSSRDLFPYLTTRPASNQIGWGGPWYFHPTPQRQPMSIELYHPSCTTALTLYSHQLVVKLWNYLAYSLIWLHCQGQIPVFFFFTILSASFNWIRHLFTSTFNWIKCNSRVD